jgi:hypothetical protein
LFGLAAEGGGLDGVAAQLERQLPGPPGYVLRRLLLVHYWHFDYEELVVPHGRLFLLGENGSGKSTILGATIPLLLDGVIRPERLDTFGSMHRKIDHYVLGQTATGGVAHQRRTAYVALEFAWHDPAWNDREDAATLGGEFRPPDGRPRFLTIGLCLAGRAGTDGAVHPYRFVLTSGRRLGIDIPLKSADGHVYDAAFFRSIVRDNGVIVERQSEYRDLVARHLFGYADSRDLDYLVDVLLLLRKPGLSNEVRTFDEVYDYLKRGLPPPPEEITRNTTEAFERIDSLRRQGSNLRRQGEAADRIHGADLELARAKLRLRAWPVVLAERVALRRRDDARSTRQELSRAQVAQAEAQLRLDRLDRELALVEAEIGELQGSAAAQEAATLELILRQAEEKLGLTRDLLAHQESQHAERQRVATGLRDNLGTRERLWSALHGTVERRFGELGRIARGGAWSEGAAIADTLAREVVACSLGGDDGVPARRDLPAPASVLLPRLSERRHAVEELRAFHDEHDQRAAEAQEASRREEERRRDVATAERARAEAQRELAESLARVAARVERVAAAPPGEAALAAPADDGRFAEPIRIASANLGAAVHRHDRAALQSSLDALAQAERTVAEQVDAELDRLGGKIGDLERQSADLARDLAWLRSNPDQPPPRLPHREQARLVLREAGIAALPFYALVDFSPTLAANRRGQVERVLADAGILDALVVPDDAVAIADALLADRGLADCRLIVSGETPSAALADGVIVDASVADPSWRAAAGRALASVGLTERADPGAEATIALAPDGTWRHGVLVGQAGAGEPLGYIGAVNRAARWQRDLDAQLAAQASMQAQLAGEVAQRESLRRGLDHLRAEMRALVRAADTSEVVGAEARAQEREAALRHAESLAREAAADLARRQGIRENLARQIGAAMRPLGADTPDRELVQRAERSLDQITHLVELVEGELARLNELGSEWEGFGRALAEADAQLVATGTAVTTTREHVRLAEASAASARERLAAHSVADFRRRLAAAQENARRLRDELLARREELGRWKNDVARLIEELARVENRSLEADRERAAAVGAFVALHQRNLDALDQPPGATDDAVVALASRLAPSDGTDPERLEREANAARDRRRRVFDEERSRLVDFDLAIAEDERDRVVVRLNDPAERPMGDLLRAIEERVRENELLLNEAEERLFKDYLADTGLTAIHRAVQAADGLVVRMNAILERTPLGRERYELRMEHRNDRLEQATPLARYHALFRKDPSAITEDERRVLFEAVRAAVAEAHRQAEAGDESFAGLLARAFDYREWFSLGLFVTDGTGQRYRISSRMARTRSGAQQLFALYVPLFAGLAAHYENAAPWSPKLFAMDEAFDKISEDNVTLLLRFLVDLGFQWIVASPRLSGAGRDVLPACADWQLYHNAKEGLAQAIPVIYCDGGLLDLPEDRLASLP